MVYIIQHGNSKRETDEQPNLGGFFFGIYFIFQTRGNQTAQAKTHFVRGIFLMCHDSSLKLWVTHSMVRVAMVSSPTSTMVSGCWDGQLGPDGEKSPGNFPTTKSKQISKFERCTWDPLGGRVLGQGGICLLYGTLWPLAVTTCCVLRKTEHCDIMSMFMNMHGLIRDMGNTIVLSWSWGFTTSIRPVRIENMLATFCLPISPHLYRICTPLYIMMGLFIQPLFNHIIYP